MPRSSCPRTLRWACWDCVHGVKVEGEDRGGMPVLDRPCLLGLGVDGACIREVEARVHVSMEGSLAEGMYQALTALRVELVLSDDRRGRSGR